MKIINKLKCYLGNHDIEFVDVIIKYSIVDPDRILLAYVPHERKTIYKRCKRCGFEKELGT